MQIIKTKTYSQAVLLLLLISCGAKNIKETSKPESKALEVKSITLENLDASLKDFRKNYLDLFLSREDADVYQVYSWQSVLSNSDITNVSENLNQAYSKNFTSIVRELNTTMSNFGKTLSNVCATKKMPRISRNEGYVEISYVQVLMGDGDGDGDGERCKEIVNNSDDVTFVSAYTQFVVSRFNLKTKISSYLISSADQSNWLYREIHGPQDKGAPFLPFIKAIVKQLSRLEKDLVDTSLIQDRKIIYDLQALLLLERNCNQLEDAAKEIESLAKNKDELKMTEELKTIISSFRIVAAKYF